MTAKQIKYFGSKRQKAALRASRKRKAKASHRTRTRRNGSAQKKRRYSLKHRGGKILSAQQRYLSDRWAERARKREGRNPSRKRAVARKHSSRRRRKGARRNPGDIILWTAAGNPARKRGRKTMARRRRKRAVARHHNAGRRRRSMKVHHHRRRRTGNPGAIGRPMDWIQGGAGVVAGAVGSRLLPQMVLGASNTGAMGYAANAVSALLLGWGAHAIFRRPVITGSVVAGGFAGLISRIISDQTPFGSQFALSGLGDWGLGLYQKSNFPYPPRVQNGRGPGSSMFTWGDGSQVGMPIATVSSGGSDSTSAC